MKLARFDLTQWQEKYGDTLEATQRHIIGKELVELSYARTEENRLEECIDIIQSAKTYLDIVATPEQIAQAFASHEAKMKQYEASGRVPKILGWVELQSDGYIEHLENIKKSLGEFVSANCSILRKYKKQGVKQIVFDIDEFRKMVDSLYCLHVGVDGIDDYIDLDDFGVELKGVE